MWSVTCAWLAMQMCDICESPCGQNQEDCCTPHQPAGCGDTDCCKTVCDIDASCCTWTWSNACANLAKLHCPQTCLATCGSAGTGNCCEANGSPFCTNGACCTAVCAEDPYCCDAGGGGEWDKCCANLAVEHCAALAGCNNIPPQPCGPGECCLPSDLPGCDDGPCCEEICSSDPFCCDVKWDQFCASAASDSCAICFSKPPLPPDQPPAFSCKSNCGGAAISGCWCDEPCCHFGDCCEDKGKHCVGCLYGLTPAPPFTSTCEGSCGGSDLPCWCDVNCFAFADCCQDVCIHCSRFAGCIPPNPADLTGDGVVGVPDLLILLSNWGECQYDRCFVKEPPGKACPGDFNHDHAVGVPDLLFLLQHWG